MAFIEKENILYQYQFGFRKGFSTDQAILEITDYLKRSANNHLYSCGIFLDFSKAFDTVNHSILLRKLKKYGIKGLPLEWFHSYLSIRTKYAQIGNIKSASLTFRCGIPQGSTLGPLLFLFYINDLPNSTNAFQLRIFADDTNILYSLKKLNLLQTVINDEMHKVYQYCSASKLSINFTKTNYMLITSTHRKSGGLNIPNISRESCIKYLGIYLDEHLWLQSQVSHVNSKIAKNLGILFKLRHHLNLRILINLYYTLIYPYLNIGLMSWGVTYKTRLEQTSIIVNKCVR